MHIGTRIMALASVVALAAALVGCGGTTSGTSAQETSDASETSAEEVATTMSVEVNGTTFEAEFADTKAAEQFRAMLPLTVQATELNGNEKYAQLDESLSMDGAEVVSPIQAGDIFLYGGNDVVLFYEDHDNASWRYVPIARIKDATGLADAVGTGDVTITYE